MSVLTVSSWNLNLRTIYSRRRHVDALVFTPVTSQLPPCLSVTTGGLVLRLDYYHLMSLLRWEEINEATTRREMLTTAMTMMMMMITSRSSVFRGLLVAQLVTNFTKPLKEPKDSLLCFGHPPVVSVLRQTNSVHILLHNLACLAYRLLSPCHPT